MHAVISRKTLAAHILQTMAAAQKEGDRITLDDLTDRLHVRRSDVRAMLSDLHRQGAVDVLTMRLTLRGFALGLALDGKPLPVIRTPLASPARVAAA